MDRLLTCRSFCGGKALQRASLIGELSWNRWTGTEIADCWGMVVTRDIVAHPVSASGFAPFGRLIEPSPDGAAATTDGAALDLSQGRLRFYNERDRPPELRHRGAIWRKIALRARMRDGISVDDIGMTYRRGSHVTQALVNWTLHVPAVGWATLIGVSGCGKSNLQQSVMVD